MLIFALITLAMVAFSAAERLAADDLFTAVAIARGTANTEQVRTPYGMWLSARLASDLASQSGDAAYTRAGQLAYRSDRLRELAAVPALIGLLTALVTAAPGRDIAVSDGDSPRARLEP